MHSSIVQLLARRTSSTARLSRAGHIFLMTGFAFLVVPPFAHAVSPAPDGGYPNGNTAEGDFALLSLTSGRDNTAIGGGALRDNISGSENTAIGSAALLANAGSDNTASGFEALGANFTGNFNTADGSGALEFNTTGNNNTAIGYQALSSNTTGNSNTVVGVNALSISNNSGDNNTGDNNTGIGYEVLNRNTTGADNTATGATALQNNTSGAGNTADGFRALFSNMSGANNTAAGIFALSANTAGNFNTAFGTQALESNTTASKNTALGFWALLDNTTGTNNIAVGYQAGVNLTTGSNNIDIGANVLGNAGEANTIRVGKQGTQKSTFIAGIAGTAISGSTVVVNSTGKLGVATSSVRFKEAIKPMDKTSEAILALKPVTFRYKEEVDLDKAPQFGLVAEDVEKVAPELVVHDEEGKPFTVRYEAVNAMLLNEFLKAHGQIEQQTRRIDELTAQLKQQALLIQKVSDAVALDRSARQTIATKQ